VTFSQAHDSELRLYFGNGFEAEYGLKSSFGFQMEALAASSGSDLKAAPEWNGYGPPPDQVIACKPTRSGASSESTVMGPTALNAVRRQNRIRAALGLLSAAEAKALRAYYTPRPVTSPFGLESLGELRAVVAYLFGTEAAQALCRITAERPGVDALTGEREAHKARRSFAKTKLTTWATQARIFLERSRASYATAIGIAVRRERDEKVARMARFLVGGA
jgi:hypothetical protein